MHQVSIIRVVKKCINQTNQNRIGSYFFKGATSAYDFYSAVRITFYFKTKLNRTANTSKSKGKLMGWFCPNPRPSPTKFLSWGLVCLTKKKVWCEEIFLNSPHPTKNQIPVLPKRERCSARIRGSIIKHNCMIT